MSQGRRQSLREVTTLVDVGGGGDDVVVVVVVVVVDELARKISGR